MPEHVHDAHGGRGGADQVGSLADDGADQEAAGRGAVGGALPPPILIRSVTADGRAVSPTDEITLPVGKTTLRLDYAALSMRVPSRMRFRYRLAGIDEAGVDAGARRTAFYNNLPPAPRPW